MRIPTALAPAVVAWVPSTTMATTRSRNAIGGSVSFADAVFNVGRTALLVAAIAAGDMDAMSVATADRLHQDTRLAALDGSRRALAAGLAAGAWCGWLSGRGPSVVLLAEPLRAASIAAALVEADATGDVKHLRVDPDGARVTSY